MTGDNSSKILKNTKKILKHVSGSYGISNPIERKDYGNVRFEGNEAEKYGDLEVGSVVEMTVKAKVTEQSIRNWDGDKRCVVFVIESVEVEDDDD